MVHRRRLCIIRVTNLGLILLLILLVLVFGGGGFFAWARHSICSVADSACCW